MSPIEFLTAATKNHARHVAEKILDRDSRPPTASSTAGLFLTFFAGWAGLVCVNLTYEKVKTKKK